MTVYAYQQNLPGSCGAGIIHGFNAWAPELRGTYRPGGAGLHCAAYISEHRCKDVYENEKKLYKIVYQSSKRRNSNSGRQFIFVVYDRKIPVTENMNKEFKFPFKPRR